MELNIMSKIIRRNSLGKADNGFMVRFLIKTFVLKALDRCSAENSLLGLPCGWLLTV